MGSLLSPEPKAQPAGPQGQAILVPWDLGGGGNPRCVGTAARLLRWVFPLQGGSEGTGSCHREGAALWSAFLGTETAANPSLCHHPEHHRAPAGTAQEEAAVSTGHSPILSAPKRSSPRSCKKQGRASTRGAPSDPRQLLSQLPPHTPA